MNKNDMAIVWTFIGSLVTLKLLTSIMILYFFPSWHTVLLVVVLSVVWFVPPVYYLTRHSQGRFRLIRARVRRNELLRQEWNVEETTTTRRG